MKIILNLLRSKALFGGVDETQLQYIGSFLKDEIFSKGRAIITEGNMGDRMYLIIEGKVQVLKYSCSQDKNEEITVLERGDSFGEMELIDIQPRVGTVKALTDVETVSLSNGDLLNISRKNLQTFSIILLNIARILSRKLRKTDELLISIHHL